MTATLNPRLSASPQRPTGTADTPFSLLGPDGSLADTASSTLDVTPDLCRTLYRDMLLGRRFDQEAYHLQRQGELGLWLSCQG